MNSRQIRQKYNDKARVLRKKNKELDSKKNTNKAKLNQLRSDMNRALKSASDKKSR